MNSTGKILPHKGFWVLQMEYSVGHGMRMREDLRYGAEGTLHQHVTLTPMMMPSGLQYQRSAHHPSNLDPQTNPFISYHEQDYYKSPERPSLMHGDGYDGPRILVTTKSHLEADQPFLYHNPIHYGSSMEDSSPSQDGLDSGDFLFPPTPSRQLGSGSGESGYHGGYLDANQSSVSSSASTNPRTPSHHFPTRGPPSDMQPGTVPHGTYGLPPPQQ